VGLSQGLLRTKLPDSCDYLNLLKFGDLRVGPYTITHSE